MYPEVVSWSVTVEVPVNVSKVLLGAVLVGALASCGSAEVTGPDPGATPSSSSPSASTATAPSETSTQGGFLPLNEATQDSYDVPATAQVTGITLATGEGAGQRAIVSVEGGKVGWSASVTSTPPKRGESDEPVPVTGDMFLTVNIAGIETQEDGSSIETPIPDVSSHVVDIDYMPAFEGQAQLVLGLQDATGYRIERLDNPSRLVVDVE